MAEKIETEDKFDWKKRKRRRELIRKSLIHTVLVAGSLFFIFPFFWLLVGSFKSEVQLSLFPPTLIPIPIRWENFPEMFVQAPFLTFLKNSVIISVLNILGAVLSCSLIAYPFARLRWPGRDVVFVAVLATMMIPFQITAVPLFLIFRKMGWIDTLYPLWVRAWFGLPFFIFLLRQFYMSIPYELEDAAKIDGCSYFGIYWRIMLPLVKPALAVIAIFRFMFSWNDFFHPLIFIQSIEKMPLALGLQTLLPRPGQIATSPGAISFNYMLAAALLMTFPLVILFFFAQKYFIQGITLTGIKG